MSGMELDAAWARIGGGFTVSPADRRVDLEDLVVRTASAAPADPRLFWVAASWLAVHHALVNARRLGSLVDAIEPLGRAAAGAMLGVAREHAGPATSLASAIGHCRPLDHPRPLFDVFAESPILAAKARTGALPVFAEWGFWQDDVSLRLDAVRPVGWLLARCPEFRSRAIFGATLEAEVMELLLALPATVKDMQEILGMTYAAVHDAASRLVARGWLRRSREGRRQVLTVRDELRGWYLAFPGESDRRASVGLS